jgi:formylglycine-generating enzyme required for sulfatase activity
MRTNFWAPAAGLAIWLCAFGAGSLPVRHPVPEGMVCVPSGLFRSGTNLTGADPFCKPERKIYLNTFCIDVHEVTNAEFAHFDPKHHFAKGKELHPATAITKVDAERYLASLGKRLPTFWEWEKAARGTDARIYPWGDLWDPSRAHVGSTDSRHQFATHVKDGACDIDSGGRLGPVGRHPQGNSPYGCQDMCGNAWEWVAKLPPGVDGGDAIRGGAYGYPERDCRSYAFSVEGDGIT